MSKGSGRRPAAVDEATQAANWAAIFGAKPEQAAPLKDETWEGQPTTAPTSANEL